MNAQLPALLMLMGFVALMSAGQVFFKQASSLIVGEAVGLNMIKSLLFSPWFISACFLYVIATFMWVAILARIPLSVAYPATSLSLILVSVAGWAFYHEHLGVKFVIGLCFVLFGIYLIIENGRASEWP